LRRVDEANVEVVMLQSCQEIADVAPRYGTESSSKEEDLRNRRMAFPSVF
jgi:hypothetical protein